MHLTIKVKSPNNISKWQLGFNSAFKGLSDSVNAESVLACQCKSRDTASVSVNVKQRQC
jgi:hypothetical protein